MTGTPVTDEPVAHEPVASQRSGLTSILNRFIALRSKAQLKRFQRPLLIVAMIAFAVMTIAGFRHLPTAPEPVRWELLLLVLLITPVGVALNAAEYVVSARLVGLHVRFMPAARVAILGSAFNLLPIPGSVLVRTQAMRETGSSYKKAVGTAGVAGLGYLATGFFAAGVALLFSRPGWGIAFGGIGVVLGAATMVGVRAYVRTKYIRYSAALFAVELGSTLAKAFAFMVIGVAIGYRLSYDQSVVIILSTVVTAAIGILPGGLGLRELLAGALSPLVGIDASVGLVITAFNRLLGLAVLAVMALGLVLTREPEAKLTRRSILEEAAEDASTADPLIDG